MFLQEADATVLVFDLRGFTPLAGRLGPVELGAALGRFYEFVEACVDRGGGRVLKLMGDVVMSAWIAGQHGADHGGHREGAVAAIRAARALRTAWLAENQRLGLPNLSFSMAGRVLAGQIGTDRLRQFDVLGAPANVALKLASVATMRDVDNLITADVLWPAASAAVEVEGIELGGHRYRLYRVD
jgi:adenylate cyclase